VLKYCSQAHLARYTAGDLKDADARQLPPDHCRPGSVTSTHSTQQHELVDSWLVARWVVV